MVRINASEQILRYQQLHEANAVEPPSLGNPGQQKPHSCYEEELSKGSETFPDSGAQWNIDMCAFETESMQRVQQTYSKSILNLFLSSSSQS